MYLVNPSLAIFMIVWFFLWCDRYAGAHVLRTGCHQRQAPMG